MTNFPRLSRRGTFWSAALVLALCLWASGAPSVLYPVYSAEWNLAPVVVTSVFGTYPLALLVVLLFFGGVSDRVGRRRAMLIGIALIGTSAVAFALAPNVSLLFVGRVLQGVGTGFALSAAGAALVENSPSDNPRLPSSLTTVSTSIGLTLALFLSGLLAQLAPLPMVLSFVVLFLLAAVTFALVFLTPDDRRVEQHPSGNRAAAVPTGRRGPQPLRLPSGILRPFVLATLSVSLAYAVGAMMLSLGAQMARQLTGTSNLLVIGGLLATSSLSIGVTALFLGKVHSHRAVMIGAAVSLLGLGLMAATAAGGSLALFFVWCVVGGIGYSFAFTGGLSLINRTAPAEHRGATLSLTYLFAYLLQAGTAIGAGALATAHGLETAIDLAAPVIGVLALVTLGLAALDLAAVRRPVMVAAR